MWNWKELTILPMSDFNRSDLEWLQFTGLLDKNGKEMYEGDVLKQTHGGHEITGVMIWNSQKAQFGMEATVDFDAPPHIESLESVDGRPEIIGNIYENPELIEKVAKKKPK